MSYCRSSSDDWQSDVYVWGDVSGDWVTSVANFSTEWLVPLPDKVEDWTSEEYHDRESLVMQMMNDGVSACEVVRVPSEAGKMYHHASPGECADNLERLRGLGLWVPQHALDRLRSEQAEMETANE